MSKKQVTKSEGTPSTELVWDANLDLNPTEIKGPHILAISQHLEFYKPSNQRPGYKQGSAVTQEELAAIINKIPTGVPILVIYSGFLNWFRYELVNSLLFSIENTTQKTQDEITTDAKKIAITDEQSWLHENKERIAKWTSSRTSFSVPKISELMENEGYQSLYRNVNREYKSSNKSKLKKLVDSFAQEAVKILYNDILRDLNTETTFFSASDHKQISKEDLVKRLTNITLDYILQEFSLLAFQAKAIGAKYLLYKNQETKVNEPSKKRIRCKKQVFSQFAPKMINLIMSLASETLSKQVQIRYREYSTSQCPKFTELDQLWIILSHLPTYLCQNYPLAYMVWNQLLIKLDYALYAALLQVSLTPSPTTSVKEKPEPSLELEATLNWLGEFIAVLSILGEYETKEAASKITTLLFQKSPDLASKINFRAMKSYTQLLKQPKQELDPDVSGCTFSFIVGMSTSTKLPSHVPVGRNFTFP